MHAQLCKVMQPTVFPASVNLNSCADITDMASLALLSTDLVAWLQAIGTLESRVETLKAVFFCPVCKNPMHTALSEPIASWVRECCFQEGDGEWDPDDYIQASDAQKSYRRWSKKRADRLCEKDFGS